jgi:AcrR family transcriptional regulator
MRQINTNNLGPQKSAEKTEAILDGAMREFLKHGYAATSMDRVAAAAGVSKATVYSHFQDKERLFAALIQQLAMQKCWTVLNPHDSQALQGEPEIVLRRLATTVLDSHRIDQEFLTFLRVIVGESGRFPELAKTFIRNLHKPVLEALVQYLASRSELKLTDPEAVARVFIGTLVHFMITQEMLHGKEIVPMESDRLIDSLVDLICVKQDSP